MVSPAVSRATEQTEEGERPAGGLPERARNILRRGWRSNRPLALTTGLMLLALAGTVIGLLADPRVITGQPAWLKPAKFAVSLGVYAATLVWLLSYVRGRRRLVAVVSWGTALAAIAEMAVIGLQAGRGTTSHFNEATALDTHLYSAMGGFIVLLWTMGLLTAGLLLAQRMPDRVFAWSLRLGMLVSLVGMGVAFLMVGGSSPAQQAGLDDTHSGAHSVGVEDGGPGLPIVGWSTEGGDLRAPHFIGLHAIQVLPVAGWLLGRRRVRAALGRGHRAALVWVLGLGYLGFVGLLTWQALRGQSVVAPDARTLGALAGLVGAVAGAGAGLVLHARRGRRG